MIYLIFFLLEVLFLTILEKKQWGHFMTPFNMLAWPYTISVLTIIAYCKIESDIPMFYYPSLIVWMLGLLLFEIPSILVAFKTPSKQKKQNFNISISKNDDYYQVLKQLAFFFIFISLFKIKSLLGSGNTFASDEFSIQFQSSSVLAHITVVLSCLFSYAIYKADSNHKSAYLIILGSLIGMYAVGTKSWIIAPMLVGYYARLMTGKGHFSLKTIFIPLILTFVIFFFSYFLSLIYVNRGEMSEDFFTFIINHFIVYCCSGALTLSIDFQKGFVEPEMTDALFGPLLNFIYMLTGHPYVSVVNSEFIDIGILGSSNVRTFFGTIYAYSKSPTIFVLLTFVYSFYTNILYAKSRCSRSVFLILANCSNLVFLTLGFFDFYWLTLSCYEMPVILLLMHYFLYKKKVNFKPLKIKLFN